MPVCTTCSGTSFACLNGKFFCKECDTLSQDFVDEQAPEVLAGTSFTTKQLKKRKEKMELERCLPWKSVEGFQQIIKAHVSALIELGISPQLDQVMQQIWFKYVQESSLAVISSDCEVVEDSENDARYRDYFVNRCRKLGIPFGTTRRGLKLKISRRAKRSRVEGENLEKDGEWLSVDSDSAPEESKSESSDGAKSFRKKGRLHKWCTVNIMAMLKVICFCYLSLRWIKQLVTVGDLIRWAKLGKIPYYTAVDCLPPHMKLQQYDYMTFVSHRRLEHEKVTCLSTRLLKYLKMPPLPEVNIRLLSVRYLHQLNLPLSLSAYVNAILTEFEEKSSPQIFRRQSKENFDVVACGSPELLAAAAIVVVMKHIFLLDDEYEWRVTSPDTSCPLHGDSVGTCTNFSWARWRQQHLLQRTKDKETCYTLFDDFVDPAEVGDLHTCMEHQAAVLASAAMHRSESTYSKLLERLEARRFTFERLLDKQGSWEEKRKRTEIRTSLSNLYAQLGRGDDTSSEDFTCSCVTILTERARASGEYIFYREPEGSEKLHMFHQSYSFLLSIVSQLTEAKWLSIHGYVRVIEDSVVKPYHLPPG